MFTFCFEIITILNKLFKKLKLKIFKISLIRLIRLIKMSTRTNLLFLIVIFCSASILCESINHDDLNELEKYLNDRINNFKLNLHRSFESSRINRKRRVNLLFGFPETSGKRIYLHLDLLIGLFELIVIKVYLKSI